MASGHGAPGLDAARVPSRRRGFTLVGVVIAMAIMAILDRGGRRPRSATIIEAGQRERS